MLKVKGYSNLYRNNETNAIVNTNANEYFNYINKKKRAMTHQEEIESLKQDISTIKEMLQNILESSNDK